MPLQQPVAPPPPPPPSLPVQSGGGVGAGTIVGEYVLAQKLGSGGMAEVWVGFRTGPAGFKKRVVLKRVSDALAEDTESLEMFLDEARLAARLQHANIVHVYDLLHHGGAYYIVMEYIPGRSLHEVVRRLRLRELRLTPEVVAWLVLGLCEGLEFAHNACDDDGEPMQVVHRDVTPQNVVVTEQGKVKLIDFGIARATGRLVQTAAGIMKGKPNYMPPEQMRGREIDRRADVYGLGATLYELATGYRPYAGLPMHKVLMCLGAGKRPKHPQQLRPSLPDGLARIIWKALSLAPEDRFQSAAELEAALRRWLESRTSKLDGRRVARLFSSLFPEGMDPLPPGAIELPEGVGAASKILSAQVAAEAAVQRAVPPPPPLDSVDVEVHTPGHGVAQPDSKPDIGAVLCEDLLPELTAELDDHAPGNDDVVAECSVAVTRSPVNQGVGVSVLELPAVPRLSVPEPGPRDSRELTLPTPAVSFLANRPEAIPTDAFDSPSIIYVEEEALAEGTEPRVPIPSAKTPLWKRASLVGAGVLLGVGLSLLLQAQLFAG